MLRAVGEILTITFILACLALPVAGLLDLAAYARRRSTFGGGFWLSLLGGTVALLLLLLLLVVGGALTVNVGP